MRWLRPCASGESEAAALRSGVSLIDTTSPLKKSLRATEQQRADVALARRRWIRDQGLLDPARLVFIDETATSTNMVRLMGRGRRGVRLIGRVPQGHWKTLTFVAALRHDAMVVPMVVDGRNLSGLYRAMCCPNAHAQPNRCDGQPLRSQSRGRAGSNRSSGRRTTLFAEILPRSQPD